ncbi:hypothetical protein F4779DRAFT_151599 [Xylariaceae sp. FL0662B]|nr:hypothetical protein F4779DRAFT_151599 [Xylariaceae sp. FL0662B]
MLPILQYPRSRWDDMASAYNGKKNTKTSVRSNASKSSGLSVPNPMMLDIKKDPYMFDMAIYATKELNAGYPFTIPEEEAAYLTLHFQAAVERLSMPAEEIKTKQLTTHQVAKQPDRSNTNGQR